MSGFKQTWLGKEVGELEDFFGEARTKAIALFEPLILAAEKVIEDKGPEVVAAAETSIAEAVSTALSSGKSKSDAGKDALNALVKSGEAAALTAAEVLGADVAHGVVAANVTAAANDGS